MGGSPWQGAPNMPNCTAEPLAADRLRRLGQSICWDYLNRSLEILKQVLHTSRTEYPLNLVVWLSRILGRECTVQRRVQTGPRLTGRRGLRGQRAAAVETISM